jgi:NAD(P)-dependent dehydrogenase (short-subunit alcohol dehydrogenase family)
MTDSLRVELAPSGARVGCAYFGFIDTDLVKASFAHPATQALTSVMPAFIARPAPLAQAVDAIERAVERRSARTWAPRYVGGALALRGLLQPLTEWRVKSSRRLAEALALSDPAPGDREQHAQLGVAVQATAEQDVPSSYSGGAR